MLGEQSQRKELCMMGKTLRTAWFLLFLSLGSATGYAATSSNFQHGQRSYVQHSPSEGDVAENPDEHIRESMEQLFRRS
jgi:hypothetical protein